MNKIPEYYKGRNGYEARKVIDNFDMNYHLASVCKYICRSSGDNTKHNDMGVADINKAMHHLQMELDRIERNKPKTRISHM